MSKEIKEGDVVIFKATRKEMVVAAITSGYSDGIPCSVASVWYADENRGGKICSGLVPVNCLKKVEG